MTLTIVFKGAKSAPISHNSLIIDSVSSWSVANELLAVLKVDGTVRYIPLCNIESFAEVE